MLNADFCLFQLTDLSIQYVSGVCRYLRSLDISGCHLVTDKSIRSFVRNDLKLVYLGLLWCPRISKEMYLRLASIIPEVKHNGEDPPPIFKALIEAGIQQPPVKSQPTTSSTLPPTSSMAQLEVGQVIGSSLSNKQIVVQGD